MLGLPHRLFHPFFFLFNPLKSVGTTLFANHTVCNRICYKILFQLYLIVPFQSDEKTSPAEILGPYFAGTSFLIILGGHDEVEINYLTYPFM